MKKQWIFVLCTLIGMGSCTKDNSMNIDPRDNVIGNYYGIRVNSYWIDTIVGFRHDTSGIVLTLTRATEDSIVDLSFNPVYSNENFSFKFTGGQFISTTIYHPPILRRTNDSLYFRHQAGLGPFWTECFTKKDP